MSADSETPRAHASEHRSQVRDKKILKFFNTGKGVEESEREKIFERFYRVDKGRSRKVGGTGLGLSIVKNGVNFHKGQISAKSGLGKGMTFFFTLKKKI